jgi:hypothetical protein
MTATTARTGDHHNDDVVLIPFATEHLESALQLSQEMSWPYRLEDWAFALITLNSTAEGLALYERRGFAFN